MKYGDCPRGYQALQRWRVFLWYSMNMKKIASYFLISLFLYCIPSFSFAFPNIEKAESIFIDTPADFNRPDVQRLGFPVGSVLPAKSTIVIPDTNSPSKIGYIVMPMGKSGNKVFLEFSLLPDAPNNYALVHGLASGITGNQLGSLTSIERILTDDYTSRDPAMKYPSQKNLIVKLHENTLPGSNKNASGNFVMQDGPSDIINIAIRKPEEMQKTFVHEFIHFFNRDVIDGNSSIMLSETLTLLFEDECFNNEHYRFCGSTDLYNSITSKGAMDPKKLVDIVSQSLMANNAYRGHEYQAAELLGRAMMQELEMEMPNASRNQRIIEATKRIIEAQRDFSRIAPIQLTGNDTLFSRPKALNTIAATLGFSEGFHEMAASMGAYYEMNVYAEAKKIAGLKAFMEELRFMEQMDEETQLEIPLPASLPGLAAQSSVRPLALPAPQSSQTLLIPSNVPNQKPVLGTRVEANQAMQQWLDSLNQRKSMVKGATPLEVTRTPSTGFKSPNIPLQRIATVAKGLGYIPRPSTIKAVWRDLWDGATGKTSQDYINEYQASRKTAVSEITDIDRKIESLRNEVNTIGVRNPAGIPPQVDRRPTLQKRINALEQQREALLVKVEELDYTIAEESVEGARRAMIEGTNKGYVDRVNPFES